MAKLKGHASTDVSSDGQLALFEASGPTRRCTRCGMTKPVTDFSWRTDLATPNWHSWCRACETAYDRARYLAQQEERKAYSRSRYAAIRADPQRFLIYSLRLAASRLGLDPDLIIRHFESHHGCCDICGGQNDASRTRLAIDHDHESGTFRGLLCGTCNTAIGLLRDRPKIAIAAAGYLRGHGR